jgi:DNA polymerase-3 subunit delta
LLAGPPGHPVVALAGTLRRGGKLLALAERDPAIIACINYEVTARDAARLAATMAGPLGLTLAPGVAELLFDRVDGDRGQLRRELEKFALYKYASPERPQLVDDADVQALAPGQGEAELFAPVAAITAGDMAATTDLLARLPDGTAIPLLRAVHRRLALLAGLRAEVDRGRSPADAVAGAGRAIFFREKDAVIQSLARWSTPRLGEAMARVLAAERAIKASGGLADLGAHALLLTITRAAARGARQR